MPSTGAMSSDLSPTVKKLNHNASERDRRKKLNSLYSSLRSLLPGTDQTKKLSIPATVSRVVKYIPDLQKQVEKLGQKKEEMLNKISTSQSSDGGDVLKGNNNKISGGTSKVLLRNKSGVGGGEMNMRHSLPTVSTSRVDEREVVIQICTLKVKRTLLSEVLLNLENEDLRILNASAFDSNGDRVFFNLHLQVKENQSLECEVLSEKLLSLCERETLFP